MTRKRTSDDGLALDTARRIDCLSIPEPNSGCLLWLGGMAGRGCVRPVLKVWRKSRSVSHLALELDGRPRPSQKHQALHSCDNPSCVNAAHLRWGVHQENMNDMKDRERVARGERNSNAKLTTEQVTAIRRDTRSLSLAANDYGVGRCAIRDIRKGHTWRHAA